MDSEQRARLKTFLANWPELRQFTFMDRDGTPGCIMGHMAVAAGFPVQAWVKANRFEDPDHKEWNAWHDGINSPVTWAGEQFGLDRRQVDALMRFNDDGEFEAVKLYLEGLAAAPEGLLV